MVSPVNALKLQSEALAQQMLKLRPPAPAKAHIPEDTQRYKIEKMKYDFISEGLMQSKKKIDDLIYTIEMATNHKKRIKMVQMYQRLPENAERLAALKAILEANKR